MKSPTEQQIIEAAEKAGLWPNSVYHWLPAFHRYHAELAKLQSQAQQSQWMPIETAPKNTKIIVHYKNICGKDRTVFAKYIDKFTEEATAGTDCETDYCEDDDTFYCKEGWVELIDNWDDFSSVYFDSRNVPTHWMVIPPAPEGDKE